MGAQGRLGAYASRALVLTTVAGLLLATIGTDHGVARQATAPAAFCGRWEQARAALLDEAIASYDEGLHDLDGVARGQVDTLDRVEPLVPDEVRDHWDTAAGFRRAVTQLRFTVEFREERILPVHLALAFGDTPPDVAEAQALAAIEAMDRWTVTGCGDLCVRWPEVAQALEVVEPGPGSPGPEVMVALEERNRRFLDLIGGAVPDELATDWGQVRAWRSLAEEAVRSNPKRPWELDVYLEERGYGINRDGYVEELQRRLEPVRTWLEANCPEDVLTARGSGPGRLTVAIPVIPDMVLTGLLVMAVEPGVQVTGLTSSDRVLAVACLDSIVEDRFVDATLYPPWRATDLCGPTNEPAVLDPGPYDVVVLTMPGLTTDLTRYVPAPDRCVRSRIVVGGDTSVTVPRPEPCSLPAIAGDPAEDARRRAPAVDSEVAGAGRVRIVVDDLASPIDADALAESGEEGGGVLLAVALPAGTTLEEVGQLEVWPSGAVCLWLDSPEQMDQWSDEDRALARGPFELPLHALPASGDVRSCYPARGLWELLRPAVGPAPTLLGPGRYDLRLAVTIHLEDLGSSSKWGRCYRTTVEVDGDVVVDPPAYDEWERCP